MKIMLVSNNSKYKYDELTKSGWNLFPSLFTKKGEKVLGIGKYELHKFYFKYLKFKPDIIMVNWVPASLIPIIFKKLGLVKRPIVLDWGDYYADMMTNYPKSIVKLMEDFTFKNSDYITTVSKLNEKRAKDFNKKVIYIPHGYFEGNKKTEINLDKLKTKKNNLKVIYLGEQSKWKKVDEIILAAKDLECDLFLFGKTNPDFVKLAGKNIHFMGYIDELEVREVLKQGDILVNTSNQDCNFKFFEYISVGKPILAFDGLPANILKHKENAYLTKDFKQGLAELINDKQLRKKLEKNVKKIKTYSWDKIIDKHLKYYKDILQGKYK